MNLEYKYELLTNNLPTLDFNSIVKEEIIGLLPLRSRSHCLFINACIHSYFYLYLLNTYRKACSRIIVKGSNVQLTKFMLEINDVDDNPTKVGIIGYGRLGSALCKDIIESKMVLPNHMVIYTRNMDSASKMKDKGVFIDSDGSVIRSECVVIFICVLASQIESVAKKLKGHLGFETVLYIFTSGLSLARLKQIFQHDGIVTESYLWNNSLCDTWDHKLTIEQVLDNPENVALTCPLQVTVTGAKYLNCLPKLFTLWIYSLCNIGTKLGLTAQDTVKLLNFVLFDPDHSNMIVINDIVEGIDSASDKFPVFGLCEISEKSTFIDRKIELDVQLQGELLKNYQIVLNSFSTYKKFKTD